MNRHPFGFQKRVAGFALVICFAATGCLTKHASHSTAKVVDGVAIDAPQEIAKLQFIVQLNLDGNPCTGVHLGQGVIVTAQHCFIYAGGSPTIRVSSLDSSLSVLLRTGSYKTSKPGVVMTQQVNAGTTTFQVPQPDLIAFTPNDSQDRAKIALLKKADLCSATLGTTTPDLYIAGLGLTSYEGTDIDGKLHSGPVTLTSIEDLAYVSQWKKGGDDSGAAPGDSGCPLLSITPAVKTCGIATTILRARDPKTKETISATARFVRLDKEPAKAWIGGVVSSLVGASGNGSGSGMSSGSNPTSGFSIDATLLVRIQSVRDDATLEYINAVGNVHELLNGNAAIRQRLATDAKAWEVAKAILDYGNQGKTVETIIRGMLN